MQKYQLLLRPRAGQALENFKSEVNEQIVPALLQQEPQGLKLCITDTPPPRLTILPLRNEGLALISFWSDKAPVLSLASTEDPLPLTGYQVDESVPRAYDRNWPDGQATPGVCLLTILRRHPQRSYDEFLQEWHGRHTPKALRIHPLWNYIRNVVKAPLTDDAPAADGLVEEHFRERADALNPVRMFGGPLKFLPHMLEVFRHVSYFLDLKNCENYWLTEYHIRS